SPDGRHLGFTVYNVDWQGKWQEDDTRQRLFKNGGRSRWGAASRCLSGRPAGAPHRRAATAAAAAALTARKRRSSSARGSWSLNRMEGPGGGWEQRGVS